ncbi:hypothetical protein [Gordonia sp. (in: high G+C Gram-positive bacteria)]|jgi:hypothetical protein|uniref:hypothetical protein n=1 Tax=Gordonia sp. (in: high G+C Gram-positive bacteria) TaxID=84139 RepID=UPI002BDD2D08|nr:hypothetical protein [Gordonia sp. (in: high G+C Gram-positive bacteria)]
MRTVEQVVAEIDAAIAGTGPLSAHAWAPGREPALELLARLGVAVTPAYPGVRDVASPCDADTIVMEVIR